MPPHSPPSSPLQVSDRERAVVYDTLFRDAAHVLVDKCVNPASGRPYTLGVIERALKDIHFVVDPKVGGRGGGLLLGAWTRC